MLSTDDLFYALPHSTTTYAEFISSHSCACNVTEWCNSVQGWWLGAPESWRWSSSGSSFSPDEPESSHKLLPLLKELAAGCINYWIIMLMCHQQLANRLETSTTHPTTTCGVEIFRNFNWWSSSIVVYLVVKFSLYNTCI